jgi:pyruvate kinase
MGDILLLDDGRLKLEVTGVRGQEIHTRVLVGGELSNNKGINRQGGGLTAPALTAKDMDDIKTAAQIGVDFVAVSFPKSAADMYMARQLLRAAGSKRRADRQDRARRGDRPTSKKSSTPPTASWSPAATSPSKSATPPCPRCRRSMIRLARDEQADHHRHADDGIDDPLAGADPRRSLRRRQRRARRHRRGDAVGRNRGRQVPGRDVESMARICVEAERSAEVTLDREFLDRVFTRIDQSIAMAAMWTAHHLKVKAIAALTQSGSTALWMSRLNCGVPIYALTPDAESARPAWCSTARSIRCHEAAAHRPRPPAGRGRADC